MQKIALLVLLAVAARAEAVTAIRAGRMVDPQGRLVTNAVVIVDGERIVRVGGEVPSGADVIDLPRYTLIPGLIDAHTHMTFFWDRTPGTRPWQ